MSIISMKKEIRAIVILFMCFFIALPAYSHAAVASGYELGTNGINARSYFKITDEPYFVEPNDDSSVINRQIQNAAAAYEDLKTPQMVYVMPGNHNISEMIKVSKGVVLVGENTTIYNNDGSSCMAKIDGSVYGGAFNANRDAVRCLAYENTAFRWPNGYIMNTTVKNARNAGISALGSNITGPKVIGNTISDCYRIAGGVKRDGVGVSSMYGATIDLVSSNKIYGMGESGIDVTHANVNTISSNNIYNVKGHGISTDTEQGKAHAYVHIRTVTGNKITNSGHHGLYLEENCKVTGEVKNNIIKGSHSCGVDLAMTASIGNIKTKKYFTGNTVEFSVSSNISIGGRGSVLAMGSGNIIKASKKAGITVGRRAKLYI